ncbi:MAG: hypothetical protein Q7S06_03090 [Nanoarchaeota archaeon]|nr:hypothetical protein [Nanoarchaeota archaeon]
MKKSFPKNKSVFLNLISFYQELSKEFENDSIKLVVYGSLAYFVFTRDKTIEVKDIDLIVEEKYFKRIISILKNHKIDYKYSKKWHVIKAYREKLKIDFDSKEYWHKNLPLKTRLFSFNGVKINCLSLNLLTDVYKKAYENARDKKKEYKIKYNNLKRLMSITPPFFNCF